MASSSTARFRPSLPTELWFRIFQIAIWVPLLSEYIPFDSEKPRPPALLSAKSTITRVCRTWRAIGLQFLYEDIIVGKTSVDDLIEGLERVEPFEKEKNGRFVRRVTLSPTRIDDDLAVLKCCPNVEIVVKPRCNDDTYHTEKNPFPDPTLPLPFLKRIEWTISEESEFFVEESLSLLWHILHIAPGVCFLSLTRYASRTGVCLLPNFYRRALLADLSEHLPQLQVLRICGLEFMDGQPRVWKPLPNLTHLITDGGSFLRNLQSWVDPAMISVVELIEGINTHRLISENAITRVLLLCPQLRELNYCVSYKPPRFVPDGRTHIHSHLEYVRLQINRFYYFDAIERHLRVFCSPMLFPSLQRVVVCVCNSAFTERQVMRWITKRNAVLEWVP